MEEHFLSEFVSGPSEFHVEPWYNREGDCVIYQTADEAILRDRIDGFLTLYRSAINERVIGFQLKSVRAIVRRCGWEGLAVEVEKTGDEIKKISVAALLLAAYEEGAMSLRKRKGYAAAIPAFVPAPEIPLAELCPL